jgi:uncharacterized protein (DUF1800 family)
MKPYAASLILGALAVAAGCTQADRSGPEKTGEAQEAATPTTAADAIRFLEQATFGPTPATVSHVAQVGVTQAITEQINQPISYYSNGYYRNQQVFTGNATCSATKPCTTTGQSCDAASGRCMPTCSATGTDADCGGSTSGLVCNTSTHVCTPGCRSATTYGNVCAAGWSCSAAAGSSAAGNCYQYNTFDPGVELFVHASTAPDQLRQRVAFALSQIWVVSLKNFSLTAKPTTQSPEVYSSAIPVYLNVLVDDAFANYRDLMVHMTLNAAMGDWLNMANNAGVDVNGNPVAPNENYARELLQLFTLGVNRLNEDGTLVTDATGSPVPAYSQDDVENYSHALTGWVHGNATNTCPTKRGASGGATSDWGLPMIPCDQNHDPTTLPLLNGYTTTGGVAPGTAPLPIVTGSALADFNKVMDSIFYDTNLPPFVCKQLIQHLVTSNPSPAYVQRIVQVFKNDGSSRAQKRGNLDSVVRAILSDTEARSAAPGVNFGRLRPPVLFISNLFRWLNAYVDDPTALVIDPNVLLDPATSLEIANTATTNNNSNSMGQYVFRPATVFSYFPPSAPLPGYPALVGPEFGIQNSGTVMARSNFINALVVSGTPGTGITGVNVDLSAAATTIPDPVSTTDVTAFVDWLSNNMLHGTMSQTLRTQVTTAVQGALGVAGQPQYRAKALGIYLVAMSPEFQIQR